MSAQGLALGLCLTVCFASAAALAQGTGRLRAVVHDTSHGGIPGAAIRLTLAGGQEVVLAAQTSSDGGFTLSGVPPSLYDLRVDGFHRQGLSKRQNRCRARNDAAEHPPGHKSSHRSRRSEGACADGADR